MGQMIIGELASKALVGILFFLLYYFGVFEWLYSARNALISAWF